MKKGEFEHIIRAAGDIADVEEIIVIGSQTIHAQFPDIEKKLKQLELSHILDTADVTAVVGSMEVDLFIPNDTRKTNLVNGTIGEMSDFHDTFGYFADGGYFDCYFTHELEKTVDQGLQSEHQRDNRFLSGNS